MYVLLHNNTLPFSFLAVESQAETDTSTARPVAVPAKAAKNVLTFKRRIKSHLPSAGIIRSSPYSPRFQDKG